MKKRDFDTKQRFGFRKYKWVAGAASVLLGTSIVFGIQTNTAHAATTDDAGSTTETTTLDVGNSGQGANAGAGTQALGESKVADVGSDDGNGGLHPNDDGSWTIGSESGLDDNGDPKHENHDIDFAGEDNSQKINYKEKGSDGQLTDAKDRDGKPIDPSYAGNDGKGHGSGTVTKSGDTVPVDVPDGWQLDKDSDKTTTLTPDEDGKVPDKDVIIHHGEYTTEQGDKSTTDTTIPTTKGQKFAQDMTNLTNTTIKQSIDYDFSGVDANTKNQDAYKNLSSHEEQSADYQRTATVDTVTGKPKSYGDWNLSGTGLSGFEVHQIDGYTTTVTDELGNTYVYKDGQIQAPVLTNSDIEKLVATDGVRQLHNFKVTYKANDGHRKVHFIGQDDNELPANDNVDSNGEKIVDQQVNGVVDQNATDLNTIIPKGWTLVDPNTQIKIPNTTDEQNAPVSVRIKHDTVVYNHDTDVNIPAGQPSNGDGSKTTDQDITHDALNRDITRTITGTKPNKQGDISENETLHFGRTATLDKVTGNVTYGAWEGLDDTSKAGFKDYTADSVDGYTAHIDGQGETLQGGVPTDNDITTWGDAHNHTVTYTANDSSQIFHYEDKNGDPVTDGKGQNIADKTVKGQTDGQITNPDIPGFVVDKVTKNGQDVTDDYKNGKLTFDPDDQKQTITVTVSHDQENIKPGDTTLDPKDPNNKGKDKGTAVPGGGQTDKSIQHNDLHKTITEVVNETLPGQSQKELSRQIIDFERDATIDQVTGTVTYGDWHVADSSQRKSFEVVNATGQDGYTASPSSVSIPAIDNDSVEKWDDSKHVTSITYTANDSHQDYKFVDSDNNVINTDGTTNSDKTAVSTTVRGKTGEDITVPNVPNGWKLPDGATIPGGKFAPEDKAGTTTVTIEHSTTFVNHDQVPNQGDKVDGDKNKKPGDGKSKQDITHDDLYKTIDRSVTIVDQHARTTTYNESISYIRDATIDDVTGDVTYSDWKVADGSQSSFTEITVPTIKGYTPAFAHGTESDLDPKTPTQDEINNWIDPKVDIGYIANKSHQDYIFKDKAGNVIGMDGNPTDKTISAHETGVTDGDINDPGLPKGWVLDSDQSYMPPTTFGPDEDSKPIEAIIKHGSKTVGPNDVSNQGDTVQGGHTTPGDGKPTNEINHNDLYKTITRNVTITDPHSGATQHNESISYTRTANIDTVTGDVTYNPWTPVDSTKNSFSEVDVPSVPGYTSHIDGGTTTDLDAKTPLNDEITNWTDKNITVTYTADNSSQKIVYHDTEHNTDVNTQDLKGQTDGKVTPTVPVGYDVDKVTKNGQDITADFKNGNLTFDPADQTQEIVVNVHQHLDDIKASDTHSGDKTHGDDTKPGNESGDPTVPGHNGDNDPKLNNDVDYDALHRTVTQTVDKYDKKGTKTGTDTQTVYYERDAQVNRANGHVTYTEWRAVNNFTDNATTGAKAGFDEVSIDDVAGYTHNGPVAAWTPSQEQLSGYETVHTIKGTDLKYTANSNTITYQFVDDDKSGENVGNVITLTGKTDTNVSASAVTDAWNALKDKYALVDSSQLPTTIEIKADNGQMPRLIHLRHISEEITQKHIPEGAKDKDDKHAITDKDFSHDVTRTITINTPSGNVTVDDQGHQTVASTPRDASQTITLTRTGKYDKVTGEVTWNPWQSGHFDAVNVPSVNGYTPSQSTIDAVGNVGADYIDPKINVTYTAKGASQKIHYVDENGNDLVDPKDASGNDVKDGTATGVTDETVNVPVPDGWDLVDSSDSTTKLENPGDNGEVGTKTVKIKHGTVVVDHKDPHGGTDLVDPNKPNGPRYDGVTDQDLNQDAIRTFVFHLPANTKAEEYKHNFIETAQTKVTWDNAANTVTVTQTVGFYRDAVVDKITGKVVGYKAKNGAFIKLGTEHDHGWIPSDASNGRFEAIMFQQIKGYTPGVRVIGPKKSVNMMVKPALFRTAMLYNISFFANATFEKPEEKEIPEKAGNQDVIPSNKTTGKDTEPAKYVPENPIQNGKGDPVKTTDGKGTTPDLPQKPETKPDQKPDDKNKGKDNNTNPVISSDKQDTTSSTPVIDNTSKSDDTQKQEPEQKTGEQKTVDNTKKTSTKKTVKKHAKKSVKKGVKKSAKVTKSAPVKKSPTNTTTPAVPTEKQAPISNANANVVETTATVKTPVANSSKKTLPQTGNKENAGLTAFGAAMTALSGLVGLLGFKKRKHED